MIHLWAAVRRHGDIAGIILVLAALLIFFTLQSDNFLTTDNLLRIMLNISAIGLMAFGQALVIITAGLDLSVSSVFAFSGVVAGMCISRYQMGVAPGIFLGVAAGALVGFINAVLIIKTGLTSFIATFGMLSVVRGVTYALSGGYTISVYNPAFTNIGMAHLGPIPMPAVIFIAFGALFWVLLRKTAYGMSLYATGGNELAVKYSGLRPNRVKFLAYIICGAMAGVAGIVSTAKIGVANSSAGIGYELDVITAVVLGGVSLSGGKGGVVGVMLGAIIMGVIKNGLLIMNISAYYQTFIVGLVIMVVVMADSLREIGFSRWAKRAATR